MDHSPIDLSTRSTTQIDLWMDVYAHSRPCSFVQDSPHASCNEIKVDRWRLNGVDERSFLEALLSICGLEFRERQIRRLAPLCPSARIVEGDTFRPGRARASPLEALLRYGPRD